MHGLVKSETMILIRVETEIESFVPCRLSMKEAVPLGYEKIVKSGLACLQENTTSGSWPGLSTGYRTFYYIIKRPEGLRDKIKKKILIRMLEKALFKIK